jgi:hypothetical protein
VLPGVVLLDERSCACANRARCAGAFRISSAKFFQPVLPARSSSIRHRQLATVG